MSGSDGLVFDVDANTKPLEDAMARAQRVATSGSGKIGLALAKASAEISGAFDGRAFDVLDAKIVQLTQRFQGIRAQLDGLKTNVMSQFAAGQGASASSIASQVIGAGGLRNFAALAGGPLGIAAITAGIVTSQAQALAALQNTADQAGVTASQLSGLQAILGKVGVSSTDTSQLVTNLNGAMLAAKAGSETATAAFAAAGVQFQNADGSLRPTIDVLQDLQRYLQGSASDADKMTQATALLGTQLGGEFTTAVKAAGSSMDDLKNSTERLGSAIQDDLARAAQSGIASLGRLYTALDQYYSRFKELAGLSLSPLDQKNIAAEHLNEAKGAITQLDVASNLRDVSQSEYAAAYKRLFDAAAENAKANPIPVLPGGDPREKPATPVPAVSPPTPSSPSGGRSRASSDDGGSDRVATVITDLERQAASERGLADALGQSDAERQRSVDLQKAMQAAQERGSALTDDERAKVLSLADAYSKAHTQIEQFKQQQSALADAAKGLGDAFEGAIENVLVSGNSLKDSLKGLLQTLESSALKALLTGQGPFSGILGTAPATGATGLASAGGLFGGVARLLGGLHLATGGRVVGPGSGTSDSIPARLSHGEFVVNAAAASKNAGLLKLINSGVVPRFADGGFVGSIAVPNAVPRSGSGGGHHISMTIDARGAQGNAEIQEMIARGVNQGMSAVHKDIAGNIRTYYKSSQMRGLR